MKAIRLAFLSAVVVIGGCVAGCASFMPKGGPIGLAQTADEWFLKQYGVTQEQIDAARKFFGVVDNRTIPDESRLIPINTHLFYPTLNASNQVVDTTGYHKGLPQLIIDGPLTVPVLTPADIIPGAVSGTSGASMTEAQFQSLIKALPALVKNPAFMGK